MVWWWLINRFKPLPPVEDINAALALDRRFGGLCFVAPVGVLGAGGGGGAGIITLPPAVTASVVTSTKDAATLLEVNAKFADSEDGRLH